MFVVTSIKTKQNKTNDSNTKSCLGNHLGRASGHQGSPLRRDQCFVHLRNISRGGNSAVRVIRTQDVDSLRGFLSIVFRSILWSILHADYQQLYKDKLGKDIDSIFCYNLQIVSVLGRSKFEDFVLILFQKITAESLNFKQPEQQTRQILS